jgi:hypothetical protein
MTTFNYLITIVLVTAGLIVLYRQAKTWETKMFALFFVLIAFYILTRATLLYFFQKEGICTIVGSFDTPKSSSKTAVYNFEYQGVLYSGTERIPSNWDEQKNKGKKYRVVFSSIVPDFNTAYLEDSIRTDRLFKLPK